mmetsp:Transcript_49231/g.81822  ORF Transcript_49231/g.81822 Transcript_49231/m.81822 type:complete len:569 (-) Transcript_49231:73-1779(-)
MASRTDGNSWSRPRMQSFEAAIFSGRPAATPAPAPVAQPAPSQPSRQSMGWETPPLPLEVSRPAPANRRRSRLQLFEASVLGQNSLSSPRQPPEVEMWPSETSTPTRSAGSREPLASRHMRSSAARQAAAEPLPEPSPRPLQALSVGSDLSEPGVVNVPGLGPLTRMQMRQLEAFLNGAPNSEVDIELLPDLSHLTSQELWQLGAFLNGGSPPAESDMQAASRETLQAPPSPSKKASWKIHEAAFRKLPSATRDEDCAICFQPVNGSAVSLPCAARGCRSLFHSVCIRPWLVRNPSCPLCRSELRDLVRPVSPLQKEGTRCPLAEFWLIELEEEAAPWLRRERRESRSPAAFGNASEATQGQRAADEISAPRHEQAERRSTEASSALALAREILAGGHLPLETASSNSSSAAGHHRQRFRTSASALELTPSPQRSMPSSRASGSHAASASSLRSGRAESQGRAAESYGEGRGDAAAAAIRFNTVVMPRHGTSTATSRAGIGLFDPALTTEMRTRRVLQRPLAAFAARGSAASSPVGSLGAASATECPGVRPASPWPSGGRRFSLLYPN